MPCLTSTGTELRVDMRDFNENSAYAQYTSFSVGDSASKYILSISGYSGTAGDSLDYHNGSMFTTRDQDNDRCQCNCGQWYKGGWWYRDCHNSNLNGIYTRYSSNYREGLEWYEFSEYLKFTEMKLRHAILNDCMLLICVPLVASCSLHMSIGPA